MHSRLDAGQEQLLVAQARQHLGAFQDLYRHYFPRVYTYVSYRVGRVEDTEDLVSDIFLSVIERLGGFQWRGDGSFAVWLFRIACNRVSDFYRRKRVRTEVPLEDLPELESSALLPTEVMAQKVKLASMRGLIDALPPRQQEIITLKFFGGLRNLEIAALLDLDERTVASHLCRGLRNLHQKYLGELVRIEEGSR